MFWPKHKPSREKHAGYEGQTCPESHWVREEGKSFLASYQILQPRNNQVGWVRKLGGSTKVIEIIHFPPVRGIKSQPWSSQLKEGMQILPAPYSVYSRKPWPTFTKVLKANKAPVFRGPGLWCGRALTVFRDLWELEVCLEISCRDRSFRGGGGEPGIAWLFETGSN